MKKKDVGLTDPISNPSYIKQNKMSGDKVCFNSAQDLKDANELAEKIKNAQKKDKIVKDNR